MTDLVIRRPGPGDHDAWKVLWDGYNAFYGREGPTALPDEVSRTTWSRLLDPDEPVHGLLAEGGDEVVGLAHYLFHRSTTLVAPTCYLQDLFTAPAARGGGVGGALIEAVRERAAAAGSPFVYWQTRETNATARRLYDRFTPPSGFIVYRLPADPA